MQQGFTPDTEIKSKFSSANTDISEERKRVEQLKEQTRFLKDNLPGLRLQDEYEELLIKGMERAVLTGKLNAKQVPGLLGLELQVRELQALGWLADYNRGQQQAQEQFNQDEKEAKPGTIVDGIRYVEGEHSKIASFIYKEDKQFELDKTNNPNGIFSMQVLSKITSRGWRQLKFTPGDWAVVDDNGEYWSMTNEQYTELIDRG